MKTCSKCNKLTGNGSWCDECTKNYQKAYRAKYAEKRKIENKKWRQNHKDKQREYQYSKRSTLKGRMSETCRVAKRRAVRKGIPFDMTVEKLISLWVNQNERCSLTGLKMTIPSARNHGKALPFSPSIDRIDSQFGYVDNNIRLLCYAVNCGINRYGDDVLDKIAKSYILDETPILPEKIRASTFNQKRPWDNPYRESKSGTINILLCHSKQRAKDLQIDFNLSPDFISRLLEPMVCSVSKVPLTFDINFDDKKSNPFRPSIDRIDCDKGYTEDNVRVVCVAVNYCLNEFGIPIFDTICKAYLTKRYANENIQI